MSDKDEEKEEHTVTDRCRECFYVGWLDTHATSGARCCDYFQVTGELRGCPAGDGCKRFRPGKRPPRYLERKYRNWQLAQ